MKESFKFAAIPEKWDTQIFQRESNMMARGILLDTNWEKLFVVDKYRRFVTRNLTDAYRKWIIQLSFW